MNMNMLHFIFPSETYEQQAIEYIEEFISCGSEINGSGGLDTYLQNATYRDWLQKIHSQLDIANIPAGKVPCITYFAVRDADHRIVGMANIRLGMNDFLRKEAGQIGYSVRPTERRKHYGTAILQMALDVCRRIGYTETVLTCGHDNSASTGVIRNCGGILDMEFFSSTYQETLQRYRITL